MKRDPGNKCTTREEQRCSCVRDQRHAHKSSWGHGGQLPSTSQIVEVPDYKIYSPKKKGAYRGTTMRGDQWIRSGSHRGGRVVSPTDIWRRKLEFSQGRAGRKSPRVASWKLTCDLRSVLNLIHSKVNTREKEKITIGWFCDMTDLEDLLQQRISSCKSSVKLYYRDFSMFESVCEGVHGCERVDPSVWECVWTLCVWKCVWECMCGCESASECVRVCKSICVCESV